jgi:SAM-dependent methyltransferase
VSELSEPDRQARAHSFGSVAADYATLRPSYPTDALAFVVGERPRRVLDLGAGTGLLTDVVRAAGHTVVAVDPSPEMLAQLSAHLPDVETRVGSAESLPLPDASVDAVVAGQAAHWFDPAPTAAELRRVLRPGGVVGLIWNFRDGRVPWVAALDELVNEQRQDRADDQRAVDDLARLLPAVVDRFESSLVQAATPEQVVGGIGTRSYAALMDPAQRSAFLGRVRALLAAHPATRGRDRLEVPHRTVAYRLTPR